MIVGKKSLYKPEIAKKVHSKVPSILRSKVTIDQDLLIQDLFYQFNLNWFTANYEEQFLTVKRSEFDKFLRNYGTAFRVFSYSADFASVICTVKNISFDNTVQVGDISPYQREFVIGLSKLVGTGMITILPFFIPDFNYSKLDMGAIISDLVTALNTHKKNLIFQAPPWVSNVSVKEEEELLKKKSQLDAEQSKINSQLQIQSDLKSVLWLKGNQLRDACTRLFSYIGMETKMNDKGEEDFWIMDSGSEAVICEVKGLDNNLQRTDISKFDEHREASGKKENFPSLLIVNSFNRAENLKSKDIPIPSNVIEKALSSKFLLIRTLDLVNLLDLIQNGTLSKESFLGILKKSHGWIKITNDIEIKIN